MSMFKKTVDDKPKIIPRARRTATIQNDLNVLEQIRTQDNKIPSPTSVTDSLNQSFSDKDRNFFIDRIKDLTTKLRDAESRAASSSQEVNTADESEELAADLADKERALQQKTTEVETLKKQREKLIKNRDDLHSKVEELQLKLKKKEDEVDQLNQPSADVDEASKNTIIENLKRIKDLKSTNNKLQDEIMNLQQYIEKQTEKLVKTEDTVRERSSELEDLRQKNTQLNQDVLLFSQTREHGLEQYTQEIDDLKQQLQRIQSKHNNLESELSESTQKNKDLKERLLKSNNELQATKDAFKQLKKQPSTTPKPTNVSTSSAPDKDSLEQERLKSIIQTQESKIKELTISLSVRPEKTRSSSSSPTSHVSPTLGSESETPQRPTSSHTDEEFQQLHLTLAEQKLHLWEANQERERLIQEVQEMRNKQHYGTEGAAGADNARMLRAVNDALKSQIRELTLTGETQNKQLQELNGKMRTIKEFNEELKGQITHMRLKIKNVNSPASPPSASHVSPDDVVSKKPILLRPHASRSLHRRQQIMLDPLGSVKRSVLAIIEYFDDRVDVGGEVTIESIGRGKDHPGLVFIIQSSLCSSLSAVFQHGFTGPFWLLTKPHYWDLICEIANSYANVEDESCCSAEDLFAMQLKRAIAKVNQTITKDCKAEINVAPSSVQALLPKDDNEFKFRCLIVTLMNEKILGLLFKFILNDRHRESWRRFYDGCALLRQVECQNKLVTYLGLLEKLPFDIERTSVCKVSSYVDASTTPEAISPEMISP